MARRISQALGVTSLELERAGAFDGFVDIDAQFHVDPHLLEASGVPEMVEARARFLGHFRQVLRLVGGSTVPGDALSRAAQRMLTFPEIPRVGLGYSVGGRSGRGIGGNLAGRLTQTAREIIAAGIEDPEIFELVGLFEEGIGADRVSDMVISVILPQLLAFSSRVGVELAVETEPIELNEHAYQIPRTDDGTVLVLVPRDVLRHLPVAHDWSEIDYVCAHNANLRARLNRTIGDTWKYATTRARKWELRQALLNHPEALRDLLNQYKGKPRDQYDFARDPAGEVIWHQIAQEFSGRFPLVIDAPARPGPEDLLSIVLTIVERYATLIEENGLWRHLYDDTNTLRHERFAQLLFYGIADSYCEANDLDLNREPNAGNGPVDFKLSRGYSARVNVEIKYSSNSGLLRGFRRQLPAYNSAERTHDSIYLVIRTTQSTTTIEEIVRLRREALDRDEEAPYIVVVDGRPRPSASRT